MEDIQDIVRNFMLRSGMSARALSAAVGHPHCARRILAGHDVRASTAKKICDFISGYDLRVAESSGSGPSDPIADAPNATQEAAS